MPRITAPTLAEHQARQRDALVEAAIAILATDGVAAATPAAVGARAGLARSSVYQYFDSSAAMLATAVELVLPRAGAAVAESVRAATTPEAGVEAYARQVLGQATSPAARAVRALEQAELPVRCRARLEELRAEQVKPLADVLVRLGADQPGPTAELVAALVDAGARQVASGADPDEVTARVLAVLRHGVVPRGSGTP